MSAPCLICVSERTEPVFRLPEVPAHSVRTLPTREAALSAPMGELDIQHCQACGLMWNRKFAVALMEYGEDYESTQAGSPVFDAFHRGFAQDLVEEYDLKGKIVVEIGCGQGEFLQLLHQAGCGRSVGYDPAYRGHELSGDIEIIAQSFQRGTKLIAPDIVICKMTLEHMGDPIEFLCTLRDCLDERSAVPLVLTVPNTEYITADAAFWDFYHEHACYFGRPALEKALTRSGFAVDRVEAIFDKQYLRINAYPARASDREPVCQDADPAKMSEHFEQSVDRWRSLLSADKSAGRTVVLWGGGSKAVAFLSALKDDCDIRAVVDINPHRQTTYLPGTGHQIIAPEHLTELAPDRVIAMNPIYRAEISEALARLGSEPTLHALGDMV